MSTANYLILCAKALCMRPFFSVSANCPVVQSAVKALYYTNSTQILCCFIKRCFCHSFFFSPFSVSLSIQLLYPIHWSSLVTACYVEQHNRQHITGYLYVFFFLSSILNAFNPHTQWSPSVDGLNLIANSNYYKLG